MEYARDERAARHLSREQALARRAARAGAAQPLAHERAARLTDATLRQLSRVLPLLPRRARQSHLAPPARGRNAARAGDRRMRRGERALGVAARGARGGLPARLGRALPLEGF